MHRLHRKFFKGDRKRSNTGKDAIALLIFSRIIKLQLRWAYCMDGLVASMPRYAQITAFVALGGLCSVLSAYHIVGDTHYVPVTRPMAPRASPDDVPARQHHQNAAIPPGELSRVEGFVRYMDSLARSPGGKESYDSMVLSRPGLLDSARNALNLLNYH